jgi:antirestriction protein ArdC
MKTDTKSLYEEINNNVVQLLKAGRQPWLFPLELPDGIDSIFPYSAVTNKHYLGINTILLWAKTLENQYASNGWLTFKQVTKAGGKVKKGEHGVRCFCYDMRKQEVVEDGKTVVKQIPEAKSFFAFNLKQVEGELDLPKHPFANPSVSVEELMRATGAEFIEAEGKAYYSKSRGCIVLPPKDSFFHPGKYHATVLHELVHWTSHEDRLDWGATSAEFGKEGQAFEKLVVAIGGAFLCSELIVLLDHFNIYTYDTYTDRWAELCEKDPKVIFKAAKLASRAHKYIMSKVKADNA